MAADANTLIRSLQNPPLYDHEVRELHLIETHISWVILTGPYAYKIKKPVNLGFLDFSTLAKRRFYCQEELRLNRRLAPELYVGVVAIAGTAERPALNGEGTALEYAVKMVQFPQEAQLDRVLARGELGPEHIDVLARAVAAFHAGADVAPVDSPHGDPARVQALVCENFDRIEASPIEAHDRERVRTLRTWSEREHARLMEQLRHRKQEGFVRECHGDMHLRNMALYHGRLVIFDCIEFSEEIRWIDVLSETAFVVMDLDNRERADLGRRFLNSYLEDSGDYEGLAVLRYYLVYRAMVRAMVDRIRAAQTPGAGDQQRLLTEFRGYLALAERYTRPLSPALLITHGLSGSGKSTVAQALLARYPAIRVRSDVERKRLHGLEARARTRSGLDTGLYAPQASARTYERLQALARSALAAGYPVIVDAAFLKRAQRAPFERLAQQLGVPFLILDCEAPEGTLYERVRQRERAGRDSSEATPAVLTRQLATHEPLTASEETKAIAIDTAAPLGLEEIIRRLTIERAP